VATLGTIGTVKMTPYKFSQLPKYIKTKNWFLKPNSLMLYIYLLLEANYQDNYKSNNITLLKNQLLTSNDALTKALKLTTGQIRTALKHLQETNDIEIKTTPKYSIITLLFDNKQKTGDEALAELTPQEDKKQKQQTKSKNNKQNNKQKTGDEALAELTLEDPSKAKTTNKTTTSKEEDKNINIKVISENDFQEFWEKYIPIETAKGSKEISKKLYIKIRQSGITKQQMLDAVGGYMQKLAGTKKNGYQQSSRRVDRWLKEGDYEDYLTEDCTEQLKEIENKLKEIEPLANIQIKEKRIIIVLPTFDKLLACKTRINNVIEPLCEKIDYQLFTKSKTTQND